MHNLYLERQETISISKMLIVGNVKGKIAVILDDIADTCGTISEASTVLKLKGARNVMAAVIHAVLSKRSINNLRKSNVSTMIITNSLPISSRFIRFLALDTNTNIIQIDISEFLAKCLQIARQKCS